MHMLAIVIIPDTGDPETHVKRLMAPHKEEYDESNRSHTGWWDWYQLGGRWTGFFDDYDPRKDPRNKGDFQGVKGPTEWATHLGDIIALGAYRQLLDARKDPYTLLTPGHCVHREVWHEGGWVADANWIDTVRELLNRYPDTYRACVVDYHS